MIHLFTRIQKSHPQSRLTYVPHRRRISLQVFSAGEPINIEISLTNMISIDLDIVIILRYFHLYNVVMQGSRANLFMKQRLSPCFEEANGTIKL